MNTSRFQLCPTPTLPFRPLVLNLLAMWYSPYRYRINWLKFDSSKNKSFNIIRQRLMTEDSAALRSTLAPWHIPEEIVHTWDSEMFSWNTSTKKCRANQNLTWEQLQSESMGMDSGHEDWIQTGTDEFRLECFAWSLRGQTHCDQIILKPSYSWLLFTESQMIFQTFHCHRFCLILVSRSPFCVMFICETRYCDGSRRRTSNRKISYILWFRQKQQWNFCERIIYKS